MIRSLVIAVLSLSLIGVGYWGYKEHEEKNALLIHAENDYQRSFHELTYHMDLLHDKIGTSLAMNSDKRLSPQFVDIWRITSEALNNVGQLPLSLLPFNKTEEFLSQIGDFTYRTAIRNLDDDPLTEDEVKTLESLYEQAAEIKDELRQVQHTVLNENLRWMDVELALATEDEQVDNTIIDGFKTVEKKVEEFSETYESMALLSDIDEEHDFSHLKGKKKNESEIEQFTRNLFDLDENIDVNIVKNGKEANVQAYTVTYEDGKDVYMDITETGGYPLQILVNREIDEQKLSLNDGMLKAEQYLEEFGYEDMIPIQSQQYDNIGLFAFVREQDGVRIYDESIMIKVALDDGEIIGLNAYNYVLNNKDKKINEPKLTEEEAREYVNEKVQIEDVHQAFITNEIDEEVLTYEFLGVLNDETYRIFINAEDGTEERIEKLTDTETNFDVML